MLRVTSSMMTNNMMVNVNRGMRNLDALSQQFFSNSKIITPSDNPIIAARAMQFRTNLVHNANFQTNVDNGLAWMDVTESAIDGLLQVLMLEARDLVHRAANDPMALEDRGALMTALNSIFEQIGVQMNSQFAGRFVFSGLRTDQPPVLNQNQPDISHRITQVFDLRDVERTRSLQIFPQVPGNPVQLPLTHDIHILKLAYNHVDRDINGEPILDIFRPDGTTFNIIMRSLSDPTAYDASTISPGEVIYIPETGELVFHPEDVTGTGGQANFPVDIQFTRSGFTRGELNPLVYFTTTQKLTRFDELIRFDQQTAGAFTINPDGTFTIVPGYTIRQDLSANAAGMVQLAYNSLPIPDPADPASSDGSLTNFTFVPASFDIITQDAAGNDIVDTYDFNVLANSPADLGWSTPPTAAERNALANGEIVLDPTTGQLFMNDVTAANFNNIQVVYEKDTFLSTDRIPTTHPAVMAEGPRFEGLTFTMDNQDLEWEFSAHTKFPVNVLAKNTFTDKLFADLRRLIDFINGIVPSDPDVLREFYRDLFPNATEEELTTEVERHISEEKAFINAAMNDRFNNMLLLIDRHAAQVRTQFTDIGARGRRLELIQNRLETDEGSLFRLMSNNENPDMARLTTLLSTAEAQYLSAIRVGTNIINVTLANFLQT